MRQKDRILVWAMFWPWSMLWTVVNDPVKEFFEWLITEFQGVYQRISDWAFKGVDEKPAA